MAEFQDDPDRQVIPRWRSFASATAFGEVTSLDRWSTSKFGAEVLQPTLEDWRREPGLSVAADMVSAAFSVGRPHEAREAADFILAHEHAPLLAREMALRCIASADTGPSVAFHEMYSVPTFPKLRGAVRATRARLAEFPINPILWTNLALSYTILGQQGPALRAMRVALGLAPDNRFVVRAACRLFLHSGDLDQAHSILLGTSAVQSDPWVLAGEIAVAAIRKCTSRFAKKARRMVEVESHAPFHLSELAGTLATMEASDGNRKKAKKLCAYSLIDPAENAIAQAAWLSRNMGEYIGSPPDTANIKSSEANAWSASAVGDWKRAFDEAMQWYNEQPFSSRPAIFGATVASTALEDYSAAEQLGKQALSSNPADASLFNNLAFAQAQQGKFDEARSNLEIGGTLKSTPRQKICLMATDGLVEFRSGRIAQGRMLYKLAAKLAHAQNCDDLCAIAKVYLAIEETRNRTLEAPAQMAEALKAAATLREPYRKLFTDKIQRAQVADYIIPPR